MFNIFNLDIVNINILYEYVMLKFENNIKLIFNCNFIKDLLK